MTTSVGPQGPATREQLARFKALSKERGMSLQELARVAMVGRCHLSGVIHGKRSSGSYSRRRVAAHLTAAELEALGWATSAEVISNQRPVISGRRAGMSEVVIRQHAVEAGYEKPAEGCSPNVLTEEVHVELPCGAMARVSQDVKPETLKALNSMMEQVQRNFPEGAARGVPLAAAVPSTGAATQELDAGMATVPAEQSRRPEQTVNASRTERGEILKGSRFKGKTILDLEREGKVST